MSDSVVPFDHASFSAFLNDSWYLQDGRAVSSIDSWFDSRQSGPMVAGPIRPAVIAYRRACKPEGTGLSHYVLMINTMPSRDTLSDTNAR